MYPRNSSAEGEYNLGPASIQLVSDSLDFDMRIPSESVSMTFEGLGTYSHPLTLFEDGMQIEDSILSIGPMSGTLTMSYPNILLFYVPSFTP